MQRRRLSRGVISAFFKLIDTIPEEGDSIVNNMTTVGEKVWYRVDVSFGADCMTSLDSSERY